MHRLKSKLESKLKFIFLALNFPLILTKIWKTCRLKPKLEYKLEFIFLALNFSSYTN